MPGLRDVVAIDARRDSPEGSSGVVVNGPQDAGAVAAA
jgi:hypothetical protein